MKFFFFISFCILFPYSLKAQYDWITYSNGGNLADAIRCIEFVNNDEIWVGTLDNGLQYFNGYSFTIFNTLTSPIPGNRVYDILLEPDKLKLIATNKGLAVYDDKSWTIYTSENSKLPGNSVISMVKEEQGRIWYGTDGGVVTDLFGTVYNSENSGLPGNQILDMQIGQDGTIWYGTENGIASFNGSDWETYKTGTGLLPGGAVSEIEIDLHGNIWISITNAITGNLMMFDGAEWTLMDTTSDIFEGAAITCIRTKKNGELWFGTHHKGLIKYDGLTWEKFLTNNSAIPINQIVSIAVGPEDNLWMGSRKGLTKVISSPSSNLIPTEESISVQVTPNPFKYFTEISVPEQIERPYSFSLYNTYGMELKLMNEIQSKIFILRNEGFESGLYFYKILSGSEQLTGKLFVID